MRACNVSSSSLPCTHTVRSQAQEADIRSESSEYDQTLYEDEVTNRIDEASTLWDSVSNSRWFAQSSLVLFLNKTDLFKAKLRVSPLQHYMPQYQGDGDWQSASAFMLQHFTSLLKNPNKRLYSHFTCATDKEQIRFVLSALQDFIIKTNLAATVRAIFACPKYESAEYGSRVLSRHVHWF